MKFTLATALGALFVLLKTTHQITWSWWWVTVPFWIPPLYLFVSVAWYAGRASLEQRRFTQMMEHENRLRAAALDKVIRSVWEDKP